MHHVRYLDRHSRSLLQNVDSNVVESLNGIIAKLIGGKRINFAMLRSYQGRCSAATLMKNTKRPSYNLHKILLKRSPGTKNPSSILETRRLKERIRQNELRSNSYRKKIKFQHFDVDSEYGDKSQKPDMNDEQYNEEKKIILKSIQEMADNRDQIQKETIEQSASRKWFEYRRNIITASNFGRIICLRVDTGCEGVLKSMLYSSDVDTKFMEYGREHEQTARLALEKLFDVKIYESGLFIDKENYFLGATIDGLIGSDTLVELKCPFSVANLTPEDGIRQRKITFWKTNKSKDIFEINTIHKYYYELQGQLHVTGRKFGIIAYWTKMSIKYETIERDDNFWKTKMFPKLEKFFFNCLLPELVDPRHPRSMPIRNPSYILEAKANKKIK